MINKEKIDQFYANLMIANDGINEPLPFGELGEKLSTLGKITLISQFETMMYDHAPNGELVRAKPLPELDLPVLPQSLWRLAEQVLQAIDGELAQTVRFLTLLYERGYVISPTVWLPPKQMKTSFDDPNGKNFEGELPSPYLAWLAWVNDEQTIAPDEPLTADNWDEFYPAQRIKLLKNLRQSDPKTALDLIAQFVPNEPAEKRLDLVEVLSINLSDDDKAFLQSLNKDRSQKIKELAKTLLARLGEFDNKDTLADDLFAEMEMTGDGISFKATKNNKKRQNNFENLQKVNLFALAKKFDLTLTEFMLKWDWQAGHIYHKSYDFNLLLLRQIVPLLNDGEVLPIGKKLIDFVKNDVNYWQYWQVVRTRMPIEVRRAFAEQKLAMGFDFENLLNITPNSLAMTFDELKASISYKDFLNSLSKYHSDNDGYINHYYPINQLTALGLLLNQDTAKECLAHLEQLGIMKTDPVLSVLHLNALLDKKD